MHPTAGLRSSLTGRMRACTHADMTQAKRGVDSPARSRSPEERVSKEPLQMRIPTDIKRAFKSQAALRGMEPNELFVEVWEHYERTRRAAATGEN